MTFDRLLNDGERGQVGSMVVHTEDVVLELTRRSGKDPRIGHNTIILVSLKLCGQPVPAGDLRPLRDSILDLPWCSGCSQFSMLSRYVLETGPRIDMLLGQHRSSREAQVVLGPEGTTYSRICHPLFSGRDYRLLSRHGRVG